MTQVNNHRFFKATEEEPTEDMPVNDPITVAVPILSKDHLERLITRSEGAIQESMAAMAAVKPDLDSAKAMYEELLQKYNEAENLKLEEEKVLDVLVRHRNGYKSSKEIRLIRTTTHLKKKPKVDEDGKPLRIPWSDYAKEVLKEGNRFMKVEDIFDTIVFRNEDMKNWDKRVESKYKWSFVNVIIKVPTQKFKKTGKGTFVEYGDLVGLAEWVDKNQRPDPKYLAQFMVAR
jgi:hypothetical protein